MSKTMLKTGAAFRIYKDLWSKKNIFFFIFGPPEQYQYMARLDTSLSITKPRDCKSSLVSLKLHASQVATPSNF